MICTIFGIVMIYSMTSSYGWAKYVVVQGFAMFLGIGAFVVFTVIDPDLIADKWVYLTIFNVLFIVGLIFFGKGDEVGSRAWYRFAGIGVQPSEIVKVIFIVLIAKQMATYKEQRTLNKFPSVLKLGIHWALYFGLITVIPNDLGSALIFLAIFVVMLICAGIAVLDGRGSGCRCGNDPSVLELLPCRLSEKPYPRAVHSRRGRSHRSGHNVADESVQGRSCLRPLDRRGLRRGQLLAEQL